ncbi:MAG: Glu/Leu/Phe/Val dehydrogenase dimerization domain-containing protein [Candidatus Rhabdochlamydia sp.]
MKEDIMDSLELKEIAVKGYEKVVVVSDERVNLKGIICIHSLALGPALGGTRIYPYPNFDAALTDATRLAKGMTYKAALAELGLGGGKSVIICNPKQKTPEMLVSFAQAVHRLEGLYTGAEDSGCFLSDVTLMAQHTPYFVGLSHDKSSGDPATFTAWGTYRGIQAALQVTEKNPSVKGKTIAIQGLGSVGSLLAEILFWSGAKLIVSDIDWEKTQRIAKKFGATACPADDILSSECDVLSPCAMGGILNAQTILQLRCKAVAGCANNQLLQDSDADLIRQRGILYTPDFVINAGGLINVSFELEHEGYDPIKARIKVHGLFDQLMQLFAIADQNQCSTHQAALALGDYRLKYGIGRRVLAPRYHHFSTYS